MTLPVNPANMPSLKLIPENAPFSDEQRAWLSGFLAAVIVPQPAGAAGVADLVVPAAPSNAATNDDAPWHDPAMEIDARMDLAKDRPLAPRLMAAMAQQDCGQCGYTCAAYANVLAEGTEARLNLCAPGGKDTARMLKKLAAEIGGAETAAAVVSESVEPAPVAPAGYSREVPVAARFLGRRRLNGEGSAKDTWHIDFDLTGTGLDYTVGDSLGVFVHNELGLVDQIIAMLGASHVTEVRGKTLRDVLEKDVSLNPAPDALFELISYLCGGTARDKARALARGEDPDGDAAKLDVLAVLQKFANVRPHPEAFVEALEPLQPRLYSISSSPRTIANRISLTVDAVRYVIGKRRRLGVASTYLADRIAEMGNINVYLQRAHGFALPQDPTKPVIMVGPGTGVAPFRAFLNERMATKAPGKNWLFFGHQKMATDFFYRDEFEAMQKSGVLSRLSLAWSRDGDQKFYLQDRMREVGPALWQWLNEGAHFYICGDAKRMAKDVEAALVDIVAEQGHMAPDAAVGFVQTLKKTGRYQADVY